MGLTSKIIGLPKDGTDPSQYIHSKDNERKLAMDLKKHYALERDGRAYRINSINDRTVCIGAKILSSKVIRKNLPFQCNSMVVACAEMCAQGVQMNWSLFLMNQLAKDTVAAQVGEIPFTV